MSLKSCDKYPIVNKNLGVVHKVITGSLRLERNGTRENVEISRFNRKSIYCKRERGSLESDNHLKKWSQNNMPDIIWELMWITFHLSNSEIMLSARFTIQK